MWTSVPGIGCGRPWAARAPRGLVQGQLRTGTWHVDVDDARITGGSWYAIRHPGDRATFGLEVTERWTPPVGQPWLLRW